MAKFQKGINKIKDDERPSTSLGTSPEFIEGRSLTIARRVFHLCITTLFLCTSLAWADNARKYDKKGRRNPFIPYVTNEGQLTNIKDEEENVVLNLEGIIYDKDGQSMAIVDGEILRKNDTIGNIKIIEIRKDSVVYVKDGEIFVINARREE